MERALKHHDPLHAEYLKELSECGIPSRRRIPRFRLRANLHGSVNDHLLEAFQKARKDTSFGSVLGCSDKADQYLWDVMESPEGRVPCQNLDGTLSTKGRNIRDLRVPNLGGNKFVPQRAQNLL